MKEKAQVEVATLMQTRDQLVKQRTALKRKVSNLLSARGVELEEEAVASEKWLTAVLPRRVQGTGRDRTKSHREADSQFEPEHWPARADDRGSGQETARLLESDQHGIGSLGASILLSVIGVAKDFYE
jgi:transposase